MLRRISAPLKPTSTVNAAHRPPKSPSPWKPQEGEANGTASEAPSRMSSPLQEMFDTQYDFLPSSSIRSINIRDLSPDREASPYVEAEDPGPSARNDKLVGTSAQPNKLVDGGGRAGRYDTMSVIKEDDQEDHTRFDTNMDLDELSMAKAYTPQDIDMAFDELDRARSSGSRGGVDV